MGSGSTGGAVPVEAPRRQEQHAIEADRLEREHARGHTCGPAGGRQQREIERVLEARARRLGAARVVKREHAVAALFIVLPVEPIEREEVRHLPQKERREEHLQTKEGRGGGGSGASPLETAGGMPCTEPACGGGRHQVHSMQATSFGPAVGGPRLLPPAIRTAASGLSRAPPPAVHPISGGRAPTTEPTHVFSGVVLFIGV